MGITINQLASVQSVSGSDQLALWQTSNGDTRKCSVSQLTTYIESVIGSGGGGGGNAAETVVVSGPTVSGFSIVLPDTNEYIWLVLAPIGPFAAGSITLPPSTTVVDKQQFRVNSTNQVNVLTINPNGAGLGIVPNIIGAGGYFTLKYTQTLNAWYRVA